MKDKFSKLITRIAEFIGINKDKQSIDHLKYNFTKN